jgi:hypothetical protein
MQLTGRYRFPKGLWGKAVLQVEENVEAFWPVPEKGRRRWRDAGKSDLRSPAVHAALAPLHKGYDGLGAAKHT